MSQYEKLKRTINDDIKLAVISLIDAVQFGVPPEKLKRPYMELLLATGKYDIAQSPLGFGYDLGDAIVAEYRSLAQAISDRIPKASDVNGELFELLGMQFYVLERIENGGQAAD